MSLQLCVTDTAAVFVLSPTIQRWKGKGTRLEEGVIVEKDGSESWEGNVMYNSMIYEVKRTAVERTIIRDE